MKRDFRLLTLFVMTALGIGSGRASGADFRLWTPAFANGATMPAVAEYRGDGCTGGNLSPDVHWSGVPAGTKSLVLTVHDPDAPAPGGWWHWVRYDIPAGLAGLPAGASASAATGRDGMQSFGESRYGGPCPPPGDTPHHYEFVLWALDIPAVPGASAATTGPQLERLVAGHVVGEARLTGRFGRPK
jgi:Raf kinase inhibitor-like YbhB/YbcL family protein